MIEQRIDSNLNLLIRIPDMINSSLKQTSLVFQSSKQWQNVKILSIFLENDIKFYAYSILSP